MKNFRTTLNHTLAIVALFISHHALAEERPPQNLEHTQLQQETENAKKKADDTLKELNLTIGSGGKTENGYFASFEKQESGWKLTGISLTRPNIMEFTRQEVLHFSDDLKFVQPDFRTFKPVKENNAFICWTGALRTRNDNAMTDYNPCESSLTTTSNFHAVAQVLFTVITLGVYSATGTSSRTVVVDKEKVLALIQQTGVLDRIHEKKSASERETYLNMFC